MQEEKDAHYVKIYERHHDYTLVRNCKIIDVPNLEDPSYS